ncbi:MAG: carboxynorspermidine decarboxylase [Spirulina sp.]
MDVRFNSLHPALQTVATPALVYDEARLRANAERIQSLGRRYGFTPLLAMKASYAGLGVLSEVPGLMPEVGSLGELRLAQKLFPGVPTHGFFVAIVEEEWEEISQSVGHLSFNSLSQAAQFGPRAAAAGIAAAMRVNPLVQVSSHSDYDAGAKGCRFGVPLAELPPTLPDGIAGLHAHVLCENGAADLAKVVEVFIKEGGPWLSQVQYLNLGGGHLMTAEDYEDERLGQVIADLKHAHPHLTLFLEPGAAWFWEAGQLVTTVRDIVRPSGIATAIIDCSFRAHLNDFLIGSLLADLPLTITGATYLSPAEYAQLPDEARAHTYRIGGLSCATCDSKEYYQFGQPLQVGDRLVMENMGHYVDVTYSWFNGLPPPSVYRLTETAATLERKHPYSEFLQANLPQAIGLERGRQV